MMKLFEKHNRTLMSHKFFTMLLGGTMTMMILSLLLISDSVIAGIVIGSDAVAGVTLVFPIYSLAAFFGSVFSLGIPIKYSEEMGRFKKQEADRAFGLGILMAISVGILLFLLTVMFGDIYLKSSSPMPEVLTQARGYLFWMRFTILLMPMQMLISSMVYNDGDETLSSIANSVQAIGNIAASVILSRVMGILGIALASFLFSIISLAILMLHFFRKCNSLRWNIYFSGNLIKEVSRYGLIDSSVYLFNAVFTAVLNAFVSARFGATYLIMVSVIMICREMQMVFDGIGEAVTPILSVYLGEKNERGVRDIYRLAEITACIEGILVGLIMIIFAPLIPTLIDINDSILASSAVTGIRILALSSPFVSLLYLITSYDLVIKKIGLGVTAIALRDVLFSSLFAIALGSFLGVNGMFAGIATSSFAAYVVLALYLRRRYGKDNFPLLISELPLSDTKSYLFNLVVDKDMIIDLRDKVGRLVRENGYDNRIVMRSELLIEELYMLILEKNANRTVLSECIVFLQPDGIRIILKDDGVYFDISDVDMQVTSLGAFVVSSLVEYRSNNRNHLTTISFNRSSFLITLSK